MLRSVVFVVRAIRPHRLAYDTARIISNESRNYTTLNAVKPTITSPSFITKGSLINNRELLAISNTLMPIPNRTVTKFSLKKGKRKTVKAVIKRFLRLHWGGWIRTKCGRNKKIWKKSSARRRRLRQHVFCNATQNTLLDKMVTKYWKKPKYYVDDVYAPYHTREEFHITRRNPREY